jgi:hypothetical protein
MSAAPVKEEVMTVKAGARTAALLALFAFAVCYLRAFILPNVPILIWGDQLGFATKGSRLLDGELPYRDVFEFLTPGTDLVYALFFKWFGISLWVPNLLMALLAAATALFMTLIAARLLRGFVVAVPALLFTGFALYGALDATHHWFSTVPVMAAILILMKDSTYPRVAAAGVLCGVTASFTQNKGAFVLIALAAFLAFQSMPTAAQKGERSRRCLLLFAMACATFLVINVPFVVAAGLHSWFDSVIVFPLRYYPSVPINNWHGTWVDYYTRTGLLKWVCFPFMYVAVPVAYIAAFVFLRRKPEPESPHRESSQRESLQSESRQRWNHLLLLASAGFAMFLTVLPALSIKRVSSISPPALILLVWILSRMQKKGQIANAILGVLAIAIALSLPLRTQRRHWSYMALPTGRAVVDDPAVSELYHWAMEHTHSGQPYFGMPPMYLPLKLHNPTPVEALGPSEYTRPEQVAAVIQGIEKERVPLMILRPPMYVPHSLGYSVEYLRPFEQYLDRNYRLIKTFSTGDEVWQRIETQSASPHP